MNALLAIFPSQTMERSIETNFHEDTEGRELLDTTTGDANPRARFSQRNLAKENYYPKGIAFLQKYLLSKMASVSMAFSLRPSRSGNSASG
jgi:hypothetical protein